MPEARIETSSDVPRTRRTDIEHDLTSARELVNVTQEEMLVCGSAATSNGLHDEQVDEIGDARILVRHVCAPHGNAGRSLGPAHSIATRIGDAPIGHSEKKQHARAHCLHARKNRRVYYALKVVGESCHQRLCRSVPSVVPACASRKHRPHTDKLHCSNR